MTIFIEFYGKQKEELLGSDRILQIDGRKNVYSEINNIINNIYQYKAHKKFYYIRAFKGSVLNPVFITDYITINYKNE